MPTPTQIKLHKRSRQLELHFGAEAYHLSAEYLRVHSPSAEVKGHGPDQAILQHGKREVAIAGLEKAGHYAIRLIFDDGHDTGIYTWDYLYDLCVHQEHYWHDYLQRLEHEGKSRDPDTGVVKFV